MTDHPPAAYRTICDNCGEEIGMSAVYCKGCGEQQYSPGDEPEDTPDTTTEWRKETLYTTAIKQSAKRDYRCRIRLCNWSTDPPSVSFAYRVPDSDVSVLADWTSEATGSLTGPQNLRAWYHYFEAFEAALEALIEEIDGPVSDGQRRAFETQHDIPHPIFEVNNVPKRERVVPEKRRYRNNAD